MEYVIWGIPPGYSHEVVLTNKATTREAAKNAKKALESKYGCTAVRIQELDLSVNDVQKMFRRSVRI